MYLATRSIMCIQCSRCLTVFPCRFNPWIHEEYKTDNIISEAAQMCPANFNFVANCVRCYK